MVGGGYVDPASLGAFLQWSELVVEIVMMGVGAAFDLSQADFFGLTSTYLVEGGGGMKMPEAIFTTE